MKSSLFPEKPILVYPSVAATIGLEEATLLALLSDITAHSSGTHNNGYAWFSLSGEQISTAMPFWTDGDIQRISASLRDKGMLLLASAPYGQSRQLKFAFNERSDNTHHYVTPTSQEPAKLQQVSESTSLEPITGPFSKSLIPSNWQPSRDTLAQLNQHNIPEHFAREHIPEFITYWRERNEAHRSWGSKFMRHVLHKWREFESRQHRESQALPMNKGWYPSEDAMTVLSQHAGINRSFIEDAIPEFELYWREQGTTCDNWNKRFRDHVHRQWMRYRSALENDTEPKPIAPSWHPSASVYDVLRLANIDINFAQQLVPEFVLYWRDSGQAHVSWNTRFLQYIKHRWANQYSTNNIVPLEGHNTKNTRDISLEEQLNDRSWAN